MDSEEIAEIFNDISHYKRRRKKRKEKAIYLKYLSYEKIIIISISIFFAIFFILLIKLILMGKTKIKVEKIIISNLELLQKIENFVQKIPKIDKNEII